MRAPGEAQEDGGPLLALRPIALQAVALPAFVGAYDVAIRRWLGAGPGLAVHPRLYSLALVSTWGFAAAVLFASARRRERGVAPCLPVAVPAALLYATVLFANAYVFEAFGEYVFPSAAQFVGSDPILVLDYVRTYGGVRATLGFASLLAVLVVLLVPWRRATAVSRPRLAVAGAVALVAGVVPLKVLDAHAGTQLPPDTVTWVSLGKYAVKVRENVLPLRPAERIPVQPSDCPAPMPRTVVVVVNESMGVRSIDWLGAERVGTPRLSERMGRTPERFVRFRSAFTSAGATATSLSSIFSGVSPEEPYEKLHRMPMLWDLAKAAGFRTAYVTAQRLYWAGLSDFVLHEPIDSKASAESLAAPIVNDTGVDDQVSLAEVLRLFRETPKETPLFVFYNTNALHAPFQVESDHVDVGDTGGERYERALRLVDAALAGLLDGLEATGRLDDAWVVSTADHGEPADPTRGLMRTASFYDEIIRVPMFMWLPAAWLGTPVAAALAANADRGVSNVDVTPTVARALCVKPAPDPLAYKGRPLVDPPGDERLHVVLNTNGTFRWTYQGFGLVRGPRRFVCDDRMGCRIFDVSRDPGETRDLWDAPEVAEDQRAFLAAIEAAPELTKIWQYFGHGARPR